MKIIIQNDQLSTCKTTHVLFATLYTYVKLCVKHEYRHEHTHAYMHHKTNQEYQTQLTSGPWAKSKRYVMIFYKKHVIRSQLRNTSPC